jgi:sulfate transport system permease protein
MNPITTEPRWVRYLLIFLGAGWFAALLLLPLAVVFTQALAKGVVFFWQSLVDTDALAALRLTLFTVICSVPMNVIFGLAAAWVIGRFRFRGRQALITSDVRAVIW